MPQSKTMSAVESFANVAVGIGVSLISQLVIFKAYGIHISTQQNLEIVLWFTLISLLRSYMLRRFFNNYKKNKSC